MQKIFMLASLFIMIGAHMGVAQTQTSVKSECAMALEACRPVSLSLAPPGSSSKHVALSPESCLECKNQCSKALTLCAKEAKVNPSELTNFERVKGYHLFCINACRNLSAQSQ